MINPLKGLNILSLSGPMFNSFPEGSFAEGEFAATFSGERHFMSAV